MADYGRFCPISLGASVVSDRWTMLILREMLMGSTRFNDIARGLPGISRSLLVQRLKQFERTAWWTAGRRPPGVATSTTSRPPGRPSNR